MTTLPSWYPWPETEHKPAPQPLLLVQAFVNTLDVEEGVDVLDEAWFKQAGLAVPDDLQLARCMRESIRDLLSSSEADLAPLREVAARGDLRLTVAERGELRLQGSGPDGLLELLLIIRSAQEDGTWQRLRVCANDECRWAFYDRSKNQQGHWCDMSTCGNRLKNREFRARKRP
jgi:predicted RNA-binding Zn ribbon-like protein